MTRMQYTVSAAMSPVDQLVELARTAEESGFDSIAAGAMGAFIHSGWQQ